MKVTKRPRSRKVLIAKLAGAGVVACIAFVIVTSCVGPYSYYSAKYSPIERSPTPVRTGQAMKPVRQTEGHTCGFCALSAVYTAYGLDAEAMRLRFRLGTDKPVTMLDKSTTGTLPQDIDRVLDQDGFDVRHVDAGSPKDRALVREHLRAGHVALALVRVNELHWLIICGLDGEEAIICDSLKDELYLQPFEQYLGDRVRMLMLIKPKH